MAPSSEAGSEQAQKRLKKTTSSATQSEAGLEGPVMSVISKKLRALKKKLKKIEEMENMDLCIQKTFNYEQKALMKSKSHVEAMIYEFQKLIPVFEKAVDLEIELAINVCQDQIVTSEKGNTKTDNTVAEVEPVGELLNLIYFGSMFNLMKQNDFSTMMLTRTHERQSCLSYGTMLDDNNVVSETISEQDLDLVAKLGNLLISRPDSSLSHKSSLQVCIQHANKWLAKSGQPIDSESDITYADLNAKLDKIIASGYFTAVPEIKGTVDMVAAAAENYSTVQLPVETVLIRSEEDNSAMQFQQKNEEPAAYQENGTYDTHCFSVEETPKVDIQPENPTTGDLTQTNVNNSQPEPKSEELKENGSEIFDNHKGDLVRTNVNNYRGEDQNDGEWKQIGSRRNNKYRGDLAKTKENNSQEDDQNDGEWKQTGSRRNNNIRGGRGGARRGFPSGRWARGSNRGGRNYSLNGNNQNYEDGNFYPNSYFNKKRGGGNVYNQGGQPTVRAVES